MVAIADACGDYAEGVEPPKVLLAAVGDATDPGTWSGIPFHFLEAARRDGLVDQGLRLSVGGPSISIRRVLWNAQQRLRGDRLGGFQYSEDFLDLLWRPFLRERKAPAIVINCFQLFSRTLARDRSVEKWFFIDQTLTQLFDFYGLRSTVGESIAGEAVEKEGAGYEAAAGVIVHSRWAADSVIDDYGINPSKVHVVVPGASISRSSYLEWEKAAAATRVGPSERAALRLVFVGKEWRRKGLDRLLEAVAETRRSGADVSLTVIGCPRDALPSPLQTVDGVEWLGKIDKREGDLGFVRAVAAADIGCSLSRYEAGGIALREYLALGLAVIGPASGGAPEHMLPGASLSVHPTLPPKRSPIFFTH